MPAQSKKIVLILALVAAAISACGGAVTTASNSPVPSAVPSQATASPLASPTISPSPTAAASPAPNAGGGSVLGAISTLFVITLGALAVFLVVALSYLGIKNFTNFRTTIDNKEWILAPAAHIDEVTQVAGLLQDRVAKLASEVSALSEALAERREHLQILQPALQSMTTS